MKWVGPRGRRSPMAEVVLAALTSHAPMITGKPEVSRPEQRDRLYDGFHELRGAPAADPTALPRDGRVRGSVHPVPAGHGARRPPRHRGNLALGRPARDGADHPRV